MHLARDSKLIHSLPLLSSATLHNVVSGSYHYDITTKKKTSTEAEMFEIVWLVRNRSHAQNPLELNEWRLTGH